MKIAILETGQPPEPLIARYGRYPDMFHALLGSDYVGPTYDVVSDPLPSPSAHEAYLITGSAAGVYENLPWIPPLKQFLQEGRGRTKLVGVCFGHQIMAEAFGGEVAKSPKGWGIGLQQYQVFNRATWMGTEERLSIPVSHQDQVLVKPPHADVLAGSDFCDIGALAYEHHPSISFQFHPEFEPAYAAALIELRREHLTNCDAAISSLEQPNDRHAVADWIKAFVDSS